MSKTLYVSDLDGTLLNHQNQISETSLSILQRLCDAGMQFTYATARSLVSARKVSAGLSLSLPVIVYNGAFLMDAASGIPFAACSFTAQEQAYVKEMLNAHRISPVVYAFIEGKERLSWVKQDENAGVRRYLQQRTNDPRLRPLDQKDALYEGDAFYYTCIGDKAVLKPIYELFHSDECFTCTLQQELYCPEYWCEIMPRKATKANAIAQLKQLLDFDRLVVFGDAINDLPMFTIADEAYAVENAVPELKQAATGIIAGNDADGVANWLKERLKKELIP